MQVSVVAVASKNRSGLEAIKSAYGIEVVSTEVAAVLDAGCDGIIVSSPNHLHAEHAVAAMEAGAHVLVEKPMALTLAESLKVEEATKRTGRQLSIAYGWNYSPLTTWAQGIVRDGLLGAPKWAAGVMSSSLYDLFAGRSGYGKFVLADYAFEAESQTWADPALGGGYIYGQLSHELGVALALITAAPQMVFCSATWLESGVEIDANMVVEFADKTQGVFSGHGRAPSGTKYPLDLRLAGETGVLILDFQRDLGEVYLNSGSMEHSARDHDSKRGRTPDLVASVPPGAGIYSCTGPTEWLLRTCAGEDAPNVAPVRLGVRTVAIMEAAVASARLRAPRRISGVAPCS